jgi:hypothetical protein
MVGVFRGAREIRYIKLMNTKISVEWLISLPALVADLQARISDLEKRLLPPANRSEPEPDVYGEPGDKESEALQDAVLAHATDVHGFAWLECPACNGSDHLPDRCTTCDGEGILFKVDRKERCGTDCPLAGEAV